MFFKLQVHNIHVHVHTCILLYVSTDQLKSDLKGFPFYGTLAAAISCKKSFLQDTINLSNVTTALTCTCTLQNNLSYLDRVGFVCVASQTPNTPRSLKSKCDCIGWSRLDANFIPSHVYIHVHANMYMYYVLVLNTEDRPKCPYMYMVMHR